MVRSQHEWAKIEDTYYGLGYPSVIEGYSCTVCGASVSVGTQQLHIEWHELLRSAVDKASGPYYEQRRMH